MASLRFCSVIAAAWGLDFLLLSLFPTIRLFFDPLFLCLLWILFINPDPKKLWRWGILLGLFKDLTSGGIFGGYLCAYMGVGWILSASRNWVDRQDWIARGLWAGWLTFVKEAIYGGLMFLTDASLVFSFSWWGILSIAVVVHGLLLAWGFPALKRYLRSGL